MTGEKFFGKLSWRTVAIFLFCVMAKVCDITGKKPSTGHNVSHSVRRTNRRFLPNLQWKRIFDPVAKRWVRIRVSTAALRTLAKPLTKREQERVEKKMASEKA